MTTYDMLFSLVKELSLVKLNSLPCPVSSCRYVLLQRHLVSFRVQSKGAAGRLLTSRIGRKDQLNQVWYPKFIVTVNFVKSDEDNLNVKLKCQTIKKKKDV